LNNAVLNIKDPGEAIAARIGYMSEDRKTQGLYLMFPLSLNLIANRLLDFTRQGFVSAKAVEDNALNAVKDFRIATPNTAQVVNNLSGGNQQKVLLSAWFGINPLLLIVDEPTRGVDAGARSEIYELLRKLAATGIGIMVISSDLPEILGISDRIYVMREGKISGELSGKEATEDTVLAFALGRETAEKGA
jgi:ABC-type sugar transport system ATPase subunit